MRCSPACCAVLEGQPGAESTGDQPAPYRLFTPFTPRFHCCLPLPHPLAADEEEEPAEAPGSGGNGGGRVVLENTSPLPGLLGPLVDYGDDDDEEGDTLPLRGAWVREVQLQVDRRTHAMPQEWSSGWLSVLPCLEA